MVAALDAGAHPRPVYRRSTRPPAVPQAAPGELLVPVAIDALARQLSRGERTSPDAPLVLTFTGHSGWVLVGWLLAVGPRFRFRLIAAGPDSTRIVVSEPALNPVAIALGSFPFLAFVALFVDALVHGLWGPGGAIAVLACLGTVPLWIAAAIGRGLLGDRHAILAREHLLEQARIVEAAAAPRVRVAPAAGDGVVVGDADGTEASPTPSTRARR
jgi:hypothetical protein